MQYCLSTIFLVFFVVAASLALYGGALGLWIAGVLCVAALLLNKASNTQKGIVYAICLIIVGIICPWLWQYVLSAAPQPSRRLQCLNNMKQIGLALDNYKDSHGEFPAVNKCDKEGKLLYSWMVEILPYLDHSDIYEQLNKSEPWNSPHNAEVLNHRKIHLFICPSAKQTDNDFSTNYMAIIGPGTIWRSDRPVNIKDLPKELSNIVIAVECVDSGKHWAEPYSLTVEEVLERMKTGKGMGISSAHTGVVNVLFADGHVESLSADMPISIWRKLLMGEIKNLDELDNWKTNPNDPAPVNICVDKTPPQPRKWSFLLSILVWLISVAMLFRRAVKSRRKPAKETAIPDAGELRNP